MPALSFLRLFLVLALTWISTNVALSAELSSEALNRIGQRLDTAAVLRGEFEQSKTLKGFKKPLVSRGNFVIARAKGVQWLTAQPFASTLIITAERFVTLSEGETRQKVDPKQEPGLRAFNETLMALLMGDLKLLAVRFKVGGVQDAKGWRLSLEPREVALLALIARIEIEGDQHVTSIRLHETSGDTNSILFFSHKNSSLTVTEIERFGP